MQNLLPAAQEEGSTFGRHSMGAAAQHTWSAMQLQHKPLSKAFPNTSSPAHTHKGITCQLDKLQRYAQEQHHTRAVKATKSPTAVSWIPALLLVAYAWPESKQHAGCLACRQQPAQLDSWPAAEFPAPQAPTAQPTCTPAAVPVA